jgi:phage baseplate assembly protein W
VSGPFEGLRGAAFPFRIGPGGGVAMSEGEQKVRENIRVVIGTRLGERPMLRQFGTRVPGLVHDPNDEVLVEIVTKQAVEALLQWEPRIVVTGTSVERDPDVGVLQLRLDYVHTNEQMAGSAILPLG